MARLVCGRDLLSHQKVLRGPQDVHDEGLILLHRKVVPVPRWSPPPPGPAAPLRTSGRSWPLHREAAHRSSGKIALLVVLGYALRSTRSSPLLLWGYLSQRVYIPMRARAEAHLLIY